MTTIKIKSAHPESQGLFVVINVADFDPTLHTPFSEADVEILRGTPLAGLNPGIVQSAESDLQRRHDDLQAEAARQREEAEVLATERLRLEALAKLLEQAGQEQGMTATQLKEALTAKGIEFKGNASKADLQALLDAAPVA